MKTRFLLCISIGLALLSCSPNIDGIKSQEGINFSQSQTDWEQLKIENNNSYSYIATSSSVFGFSRRTTITVKNGAVFSREYISYAFDEENQTQRLDETYFEETAYINTHANGFKAQTIDQLYNSCIGEYLAVSRKKNSIYFETFSNNVISKCGYVPEGCMDDCFTGFSLTGFEWVKDK